jgi:hypothetical protein
MTQPEPLDLAIPERAAINHLQCIFKRMTTPAEKMCACLLLIERAAWLADETTDLTNVDLIVEGSQAFNEQVKDVGTLVMEIRRPKSLNQLAIDVLRELQNHESS